MIQLANLTPFPFTGWVRAGTDFTFPAAAMVGDGVRVVVGERTGLDQTALHVKCTLAPWEEKRIDPASLTVSALAYPAPLPANVVEHFGGVLTCNGVPMDVEFTADGPAYKVTASRRLGHFFVNVWLRWVPGEPWAQGEAMVTCSRAGTPDLTAAAPEVLIQFGDGITCPLGLPAGASITKRDEVWGDGQAAVVPLSILWLRHASGEQMASFAAVKELGISLRAMRETSHDGTPTFPPDFSARAWAAQHWGRCVALLHSWDSPSLGVAADSGQAGNQEDQCFRGVEAMLSDGAGAETVNYLAGIKFANRPCHHLEENGQIVDALARPGLRMFYSRPHRSGSDMLGKTRDLTIAEARGWNGPDAQHLFFSRLAMAARFRATDACQRLLEHQARNFLIQFTTSGVTSTIWSDRELGWITIALVHLWRQLADRGLADRLHNHWNMLANHYASKLPVNGPWHVFVDDPRLGTGSWWAAWQKAIAVYGLDLACRVLGDAGSHLPLIAKNGARHVVLQAYQQEGGRWVEYELAALDGRRQRSGMFATSWMPLGVSVFVRYWPDDPHGRAIWQQIIDQSGGDGRWIPRI